MAVARRRAVADWGPDPIDFARWFARRGWLRLEADSCALFFV